jgi:hypothetical protein
MVYHLRNRLVKDKKPRSGNFSYIKDHSHRFLLKDAYDLVETMNLWGCFRRDPGSGGYSFAAPAKLEIALRDNMRDSNSLNGSSISFIMRQLQYIYKNGLDAYKVFYFSR